MSATHNDDKKNSKKNEGHNGFVWSQRVHIFSAMPPALAGSGTIGFGR